MKLLFQILSLLIVGIGLTACGPGAGTVGDPVLGEELYATRLDDAPGRHSCADCHRLDEIEQHAPTFLGIGERAGQRKDGVSAEDYLRESIVDPKAYIIEGFSKNMPLVYGEILTDEDVNNLIAFMLSQ